MRGIFLLALALLSSTALAAARQLSISSKGNELAYEPSKLSARTGEELSLTFSNGASKQSGMKHSWVLVKPGAAEKIASDAGRAGVQKDYIPDSPDVVAHSQVIEPGESETILFKAPPEPGSYPFICVVPGHYPMMKGMLEVAK